MSNRKDKKNLLPILVPKQEECIWCLLSQSSCQPLFSEAKTVGHVTLNTHGKWYLFVRVICALRERKTIPIPHLSFRTFHWQVDS